MDVNHVLETERLILRPGTVHDHTVLLAHWTDPEVRRFLFDDEVLPAGELLAVIERLGMAPYGTVPGVLGPVTRYRRQP